MERRPEGKLSEVGRLYLYLQRGHAAPWPPPHNTPPLPAPNGTWWPLTSPASTDVAVGAPFGGDSGSGQVLIFRGQGEGLEPVPTQRLDSPFPGPAAFGFALRGATDLDRNGYMDLLVGAFGAAKVAVYWGQPVVVARAQLSVPSGLNPETMDFPVVLCVSVTGQNISQSIRKCLAEGWHPPRGGTGHLHHPLSPLPDLDAELQLDRLKPKLSRRVLLLQGHQTSWHQTLVLAIGMSPLCHNLTAYLRDKADFKDKLSPIVTSLSLAQASSSDARGLGLVLYGDTLVQAQVGPSGDTAGDSHHQALGHPQPQRQAVQCSSPTTPTLSLCLSLGHGPVLSTSLGCPHCHSCCPQCLPEMSSLSPLLSAVPAQDVLTVPPPVPAPPSACSPPVSTLSPLPPWDAPSLSPTVPTPFLGHAPCPPHCPLSPPGCSALSPLPPHIPPLPPTPPPAPAQTHIVLEDCGEDNVCVPDLRLTAHTPGTHLLIGAENVVSLRARATNAGEGAFEAELRVQLPEDTYYQKALSNIQGQEKLSCIPRKENGSRVVLCELGNPMKAGAQVWAVGHPLPPAATHCHPLSLTVTLPAPQITVDMELSVTGLEDVGDAITFQLQLRSKNSPTSAVVTVVVPVEAQAEMELRGKSLPTTMVLPTNWHGAEGSRRLEDHGIRVEHVYQLHNKGPATVTNVTLHLDVPTEFDGRILFYLLELGTEGGISCTQPPGLNPKQLEMPQPTGVGPHNETRRRERREADEPVAATALEKPIPVDCGNATCVEVTCWVPSLVKDQRVLVSVRALLWMDTLQQREHLLKQFLVQSRGFFNTSAMPYRVQPHVLPAGEAEAATEVMRASPDGKRDVPVWWVVLGILAGILLLMLLILLMWKVRGGGHMTRCCRAPLGTPGEGGGPVTP
ncbi:Integrin alpha-IIb [Aix galericulata]|nr:Integrin alpha-IIb [Aix galericulata]